MGRIKLDDISEVVTFARVLDVEQTAKNVYQITLKGVGRHKIIDSVSSTENIHGYIKNIEQVKTEKLPYSEPDEQYLETELLINKIEETMTEISRYDIWEKLLQILKTPNPWIDYEHYGDDHLDTPKGRLDINQGSLVRIISQLIYYTHCNSIEKLSIFEAVSVKEQALELIKHIQGFYSLMDWSPVEKRVFAKLEFFQGFFEEDELKAIEKTEKDAEKKANSTKRSNDAISDALVENELNKKIKDNLERQQREFLLKEKLRAIKEQLQEGDGEEEDDSEFARNMKDKQKSKVYPESVLKLIKSESNKLKTMMSGTPDANITTAYLNLLKTLPWRKVEVETLDIKKAREILDKNHYGLGEVKERIIEYLSLIINHKNQAKLANKDVLLDYDDNHQIDLDLFKEQENANKIQKNFNNVPILTLVGPPGTGKTSLARAIAEALNKSYVKISLGGVHDESEIRGHRKTYVGAMPGKIMKAIQKTGVSNPLILLDEIDKMSSDYKGDPSSAMLEVLDPEQNTKFQDNYLEHEYDLSKVMFIATANYYENIPKPLLDRVEIIELHSYTTSEKVKIAREHLIDITTRQSGLTKEQFQISDDVIESIIKHYTTEAGVRGLKRQFDKMARKIVTKIVAGENIKEFIIDKKTAFDLLGTPKYSEVETIGKPQIGVVNGLAYTSIGGSTLQIEVIPYPNKNGGFKLTGSLKDVMKESASIAYSFVRSNAKKFNIDFEFENNEVHIHVPEGAVPKDGPSAGVTFTTALISALANKPVPQDVAMTGEITLRGRVLEIGGLKEKSFAAFKKGVKTVFIPKTNEKNLVDIPDEVRNAITFIAVEDYDQIFEKLFK
nr:endopeptidase La [Mycoplasma simbae]